MYTQVTPEIASLLNSQYNFERESAAKYLSMAAAFDDVNWSGFAHWMKKQAEEEASHAAKFFEYMADRQVTIAISALPTPPEFNGADFTAIFDAALSHESVVTERLTRIAQAAFDTVDLQTFYFMDWFLKEQTEEESILVQILADLAHCGNLVYLVDRKLGER